MDWRDLRQIINEAAKEWQADKASRLGAALAFYSTFSIGPLLILTIAVAGMVFGEEAAQGELLGQLRGLIGDEGAKALQAMLASAQKPAASRTAAIVGAVMLVVGATGLFGALQDALDTVWEVQPKPGRGIWGILQERFLSFTMILGSAFLLLVSLIINTVLTAMSGYFGRWHKIGLVGQPIDMLVSFAVITLLFAMIFKYLPDAIVAWRDVWFGAAVTSLLFAVGKFGIGLYLGHSAIASAYGAAGSLAVLLVWLYYSAQIFLFGAELTRAHARRFGQGIIPAANAERVTAECRKQEGIGTKPA